jgi:hypothetical protein
MNIIFELRNFITLCTCSSNLKYAKKFNKMKKTNEIYKKIQNNPKFEQGVSNNVGWLQKNEAKKKTKINSLSVVRLSLGEETLPRVPGTQLSRKSSAGPAAKTLNI